ncbi:AcrR family transcriptional regulator [Mycobacterium sp. MAA66]|uniref:TetR/AcrR family transcriptional regulator n=1 Tax=Mycobacterium sp. MAA66 TaxID=3156297 RepID=UPI003511AA38
MSDKPARGTRPSNRRELILIAAEDLFYRNGFANVGVGDIADAVAIGPSALYRHFGSKQELLAQVVTDGLDATDKMLAESSPATHALAANVAASMIEHRSVGILWHRESRNLPPDSRAAIRSQVRDIGARLAAMIVGERPNIGAAEADLLAWCVLGAGTSISYHNLELPEPDFSRLLTALIVAVLEADVPTLLERTVEPAITEILERSRRDTIITRSVKLFVEQGYSNVGIEDIGAAVGIAGPSVYNHFDTKADILVAAMERGDEWLRVDMNRTLARATDSSDGLRRLVTSYCEFVFEYPQLVQLLITEIVQLPPEEQHRMRTAQYQYVAEWVRLVRSAYPGCDATSARIRVQAVINMINDIALTGHLRCYDNSSDALVGIGMNLLTA